MLVINKPPLLATMGARAGERNLIDLAQSYIKHKYNKPGNVYLGIVSRLDSFVSGVIVLARTSKAARRLTEQFRNRSVEKTYWAIVPDRLPAARGYLENRLVKDEARHRMLVLKKNAPPVAGEKIAKLRYRTLGTSKPEAGDKLRWIEVELETGRKHQIRVQLENAGCPILGDKKYGSDHAFKKGVALHSRKLVIEHPTQRVLQSFQAEPPIWWNLGDFTL